MGYVFGGIYTVQPLPSGDYKGFLPSSADVTLGGIGERLAAQIEERTGHDTRSLALGHLQRGGVPSAYDHLLSIRFGSAAVELVRDRSFGCMVALDQPNVLAVSLSEAIAKVKLVPVDGDVVQTARSVGISFGDEQLA